MSTLETLSTNGMLEKLPPFKSAKLPASYEAARNALAQCTQIDECKAWADKAEALASYARQANDEQLRKYADRIQARAINRCGELLKQIPRAKNQHDAQARAHDGAVTSRSDAARDAGLSERQKVTALRVANVPRDQFDKLVESDNPPTVTKLAELGKQKPLVDLGKTKPKDFALATQAMATLRRFAEFCATHDPAQIAAGVTAGEAKKVQQHVRTIDKWLDQFVTRIGD